MRHLLAADRVRFGSRRDLWVLVILIPVTTLVLFLGSFNSVLERASRDQGFFFDPDYPPSAEELASIRADLLRQRDEELVQFAFPASLVRVAESPIPLVLLAVYLAIALVAGEWEWGTIRTLHLTAARRRVLAVRIGVIFGIVGLAAVASLLVGAILPFLLSVDGGPLQRLAVPVPDLASVLGSRLLVVVPFISIPILLGVVARSTGLAFVLTVLYYVVDLAYAGAPIWEASGLGWLRTISVSGAASRLLGGDESSLAAVAPGWLAVVALLGWAILPPLAAIGLIRRIDIEE